MKIEDLDKPFNMKQKCSCGGDYWSVNYLGFNAPNAKCQTCGKETTLCPEHNLIILKQGDEKMKYKIFEDGTIKEVLNRMLKEGYIPCNSETSYKYRKDNNIKK